MRGNAGRSTAFVLFLLLAAGGGGAVWLRAEGSAPTVDAPESVALGAGGRSVELQVADQGSGLRRVQVVLEHPRGEVLLLDERYPGNWLLGGQGSPEPQPVEVRIEAGPLDLAEGSGFLRVSVSDWSWRGLGGNETRVDIPVVVDLEPPRIEVASGLTYVTRGGSGAVVYSVSEPVARDGVSVGDTFYRGFPLPSGPPQSGDQAESATSAEEWRARFGEGEPAQPAAASRQYRVALFAVSTDAPAKPVILVVAEDAAGNAATAGWPAVVKERSFPSGDVRLPPSFLDTTVRRLAAAEKIDATDPAEAFREINTRVRDANEARIREITADSSQQRLWDGAFEQLRNSKVTSRFAEKRRYLVSGEAISEATHYGFDLASTKGATVTAANAGRVLFAGELGIYGRCVLVDHGLGLSSLYAHLSQIDVAVGDAVAKGQRLGRSGATGLAGGDHLHFALLVGQTYVDPLEWWDPKWVRSHIDDRLHPSGG
ncbi:MAG: M23 family metallopeptidase [Myxococcota bacterium]